MAVSRRGKVQMASSESATDGAGAEGRSAKPKIYTKEQVSEFLGDIARRMVDSGHSSTHCLLALNHLLTLPNAQEVFDKDLKEQARDLWVKLKSGGLQLNDPPLLFGTDAKIVEDDSEEDDA